MGRQVLTRPDTAAAPYDVGLGALDVLTPDAIFAHYDGSGAGGSFLPCVTYYTQDGKVFARAFPPSSVAAGASADVSFFPGLSQSPAASSTASGTLLDYTEITATVVIDSTNGPTNQKTAITSGSITVDGATRLRIEAFTPVLDIEGNHNVIVDLWEDAVDLGRLGQFGLDPNPNDLGVPVFGVAYRTPAAGTHVYRVKLWTSNLLAANGSLGAGPGGVTAGSPNVMAAFLAIFAA